ncbi:MAG: hypothetical protein AB7N76_23440 [Planctomycetota bacterium]
MHRPTPVRLAPALLLLLAAPAAAQQQFLEPRGLTRSVDTVVIPGSACGKAKGAKIDRIRVYACRNGMMLPICYQIDERDPAGVYCWSSGPKEYRRSDNDNGGFDGNDELVILARDAGNRALPMQLMMVPGAMGHQEIELTDPKDKRKAWIYLFLFPPALSPGKVNLELVDLRTRAHDDGEKTYYWRGESFLFNNDRSRANAVRATYAGFASPGTRDYTKVPNLIDSTQVRAVVSFMWITLTRQSNDIKVEIGGIIDGPLRVIAENRLSVYLTLGYWVKAPASYLVLWRNKMSMPTNASCPVNLDTSDESSYTLCIDMNKEAKGLKFFNSHNKKPVAVDGKMSAEEQRLDTTYPDWNCVYGAQGAMISKFVIPDFLRQKEGSKLIYVDDASYERPEDEEGLEFQKGAIGYNGYVMDMRGLKKGLYPGDYVVWYAPPGFKPGDEAGYLNEYDHPVEAKATAVAR